MTSLKHRLRFLLIGTAAFIATAAIAAAPSGCSSDSAIGQGGLNLLPDGTCPMEKCANQGAGCICDDSPGAGPCLPAPRYACIPDPNRGVGSLPANSCVLRAYCNGEPRDGGTDKSTVNADGAVEVGGDASAVECGNSDAGDASVEGYDGSTTWLDASSTWLDAGFDDGWDASFDAGSARSDASTTWLDASSND